MYDPVFTRQFDKDVKRAGRRGKDLEKRKTLIRGLLAGENFDPARRDHRLVGDYAGRRECHIAPDWLLIYKLEETRIIFERTGTHADLFK